MCILQNTLMLLPSKYLSKQGEEIKATLPVWLYLCNNNSINSYAVCIIAMIKFTEILAVIVASAEIKPAHILLIIMLHHGKAR